MFELLRKFFTREAYAVRFLRVLLVAAGMLGPQAWEQAAGVPLPGWARLVLVALGLLGAAITGDNQSPSGIPRKPQEG